MHERQLTKTSRAVIINVQYGNAGHNLRPGNETIARLNQPRCIDQHQTDGIQSMQLDPQYYGMTDLAHYAVHICMV